MLQEFEKMVNEMAEVQKYLVKEVVELRQAIHQKESPPPTQVSKLSYTVTEAALATGLKRQTIRAYIKKGILNCVPTEKNFLITADSLHAWVQAPLNQTGKRQRK
ncbi:MAG: helix-turn-helix domain-containing protein [Bacteroidetes bacterium]|nr:helix-turn-helix domain-containing protein [Bacteroidota bacterium]